MTFGLDHIPASKQRELDHVARVLFETFEAAAACGSIKWKKQGRIFKLVLYGSYARGDWVEDHVGGYVSDYDVLVVVNDERLTDFELWAPAEDRLMRETTVTHVLSAPVSFIVHSFNDVNAQLERGRPFFIDIVRQGIALYEAEGFCFTSPRDLPPDEARSEAQRHFDKWFPSGDAFRASAAFLVERGNSNEAAFNYHQATERLYHCVLLVLTLYSPKSHKLNFLRGLAEETAPALTAAWPRAEKVGRRRFDLLRQAYVSARYSPHYSITDEELRWIARHVSELQALVKIVCEQRLAGIGT